MRRAVTVLVGVVIACSAAGIGAGAPAEAATVVQPVDSGTLTVCLGGTTCTLYNGSVGLAPNPSLISNTLKHTYDNSGFIFSPQRFAGALEAVGVGGQTAKLSMNVTTWFGFLTTGNWSFTDPGAGVSVYMQVFKLESGFCGLNICPPGRIVVGDTKGFFAYLFNVPGNIHGTVTIV